MTCSATGLFRVADDTLLAPARSAAIALCDAAQRLDQAALSARVLDCESTLWRQGLCTRQAVLAPVHPGIDLVVLLHACWRIGAAVLPYNHAVVSPDGDTLAALAVASGAEWCWHPAEGHLVRTAVHVADPAVVAPAALLIRTSGTTGAPKIVMLTQDNLLASARAANARLALSANDLWLDCLPLHHIGGLSIIYRCALAGAAVLLHERFDAAAVMRDLHARRVTHLSLVPAMLARLLDLGPSPPWLRVALVGGQATSRALAERALADGWPLHLTYGMSETGSQVATTGRLRLPLDDPAIAGLPLDGVELLAPGCGHEPGRLRLRGSLVMAGYANGDRRPGCGLTDGWFEAADLGCRLSDGRLRINGRGDDVLVIGGNNVSRAHVEALLRQAPGLDDLLIVDHEDAVWGRRLTAVYAGTITPEALRQWARARLTGAECPRAFRQLAMLPLLPSGKLDRQRVTQWAGEAGAAQDDPA